MPRGLLSLLLALVLVAPLAAQPSDADLGLLRSQIEAQLDARAFDDAFWGVYIVDLTDDRVLYDRDSNKRFIPASNMKLYSTATILDALGPDYRYPTRLWADGDVRGGTLVGSLIVQGSGDPTIGGRYTDGDMTKVFREWADDLKRAGITRISGSIIGDDDVFDDQVHGQGWEWDDFVWYYAAEISGLQYNEGTINLATRGTRPGQRARISVDPDVGYIDIDNQTRTTSGGRIDEGYARVLSANDFTVTTTVPSGETEREAVAIHNPTQYFVHTLQAVLEREGISVEGDPIDIDDWEGPRPRYDGMALIATHLSPTMAEIVGQTNTDSNNLYAEHLLRTLGTVAYEGDEHQPGSWRAGVEAMNGFFRKAGIDPSSISIFDGSGLAARSRITPYATVRLLRTMRDHPAPGVAEAFYQSLPRGGYTGTLKRRYASGDARGNVRAKTGFITNARTLSGYVTADNGHTIAFSLMCNDYSVRTSRVNQAQDAIVELLADYDD